MYVIAFITCPAGEGKRIAEVLLKEKLAACINIAKVSSFYCWEKKMNQDREDLLIVKTRNVLIKKLEKTVKRIHPYNVPEIIWFRIDGSKEYLSWIKEVT